MKKYSENRILRDQAEGLHKKKIHEDGPPSEELMLKLIHELEVHQIELELQNAELEIAKSAAQKAVEKYTELYDFAPSGYFTLSTGGKIINLNLCGSQMLGKVRSKLINSNLGFFVSDDTRTLFNYFLKAVFLTKAKETCEVTLLTPGAPPMYVHLSGIFIEDEQQCFLTMIDLTEKKKIEQKLHEVKEKLNLALDNGKIGIWERDLETGRLTWDKWMERMFGIERGSFEGTYEAFEKCLVEEDIPHTREAIRRAEQEDAPYETIYRVKLPNGNINHIKTKGLVIYDKAGKKASFSGVCFDITEMKKGVEETLFNLNEELLRSNKELEQFAYVASHDLQEPLRMISNFIQLLGQRYKGKLDDDADQFIHYAVDGAARMQGLIMDLLKYSRITTRGQIFQAADFNTEMNIVINHLDVIIKEKNAIVHFEELPVVVGDEGQLVQLMQNLVHNALNFCIATPIVHIAVKENPYHFTFSVKDNGIGIEQQYFDRVFLMFQQLLPKEESRGNGIGLAICKRIVERHGGKIWIESQIGEGTTFYFTIPKAKL